MTTSRGELPNSHPIGKYLAGSARLFVRLLIQHAGPKLATYSAGTISIAITVHRNRRLSQNSVSGPRRFRAGLFMPGIVAGAKRGRESFLKLHRKMIAMQSGSGSAARPTTKKTGPTAGGPGSIY